MNVRKYGWALVYALGGLALVLLVVGVNRIGDLTQAIRDGQQQRAPLLTQTNRAAKAAERGTRRIEDCTTPGRPCYDRGQEQLGTVVAGLTQGNQRAASAAAACAANLTTPSYAAVYRCVLHTIAGGDKPSP